MPRRGQLDVFISSTCYDLIDLRAELGRYLQEQGFLVRLSDDPGSDFSVEPTSDSIESCLANVEAADAVICIIDRRYGGVFRDGKYEGKSATHVEVDHARSLSPPKRVFFFMRDKAAAAFGFMRDNGVNATTRWLEEKGEDQRKRWFEFVRSVSKLPKHDKWSNWYDPFKDIVDLKQIVFKRLVDVFPKQAPSLAMSPHRLVRLTFVPSFPGSPISKEIYGAFRNVGTGPALNLEYGIAFDSLLPAKHPLTRGGLGEGETLENAGRPDAYGLAEWDSPIVFCEYQNRFGDKYRVEREFTLGFNETFQPQGRERFFVAISQEWDIVEWREIGSSSC